jgi:hypothetical protein
MFKKLLFTAVLFCSSMVFAQYTDQDTSESDKEKEKDEKVLESDRPEWVDNITIGGDLGLFFTGYGGYIGLGPKIGYQVKKWFNPGITLRYSYNYAKFTNGQVFSNHTYGTGVFTHFRFFDKLFAGLEYEILNVTKWNSLSERTWANVLFVEVGYSQDLGGFGFMNLMLQYDVINSINSPFRGSYFLKSPLSGNAIPLRYQVGFTFFLGKNR